jgi:hypothetical protein
MRPNSAQRCRVGTALPGLSRPSGSNAALRAWNWASSSGGELAAHGVQLLDADAVLAGDRAADLDAQVEDVGAEGFGALHLAGLVGVEQDERDAGCRRRHGTRWRRAGRIGRQLAMRASTRPDAGAGWCRPCSSSPGEMRPTAGKAPLRPAQNFRRCASSWAVRTSVAPASMSTWRTAMICSETSALAPSSSHKRMAAASTG